MENLQVIQQATAWQIKVKRIQAKAREVMNRHAITIDGDRFTVKEVLGMVAVGVALFALVGIAGSISNF